MADALPHGVRLDIDYPVTHDKTTTAFRLIWAIPVLVILGLISSSGGGEGGGGIAAGISVATALMIVFRQKYPRWWFDFQVELARFGVRVGAYVLLLTDTYPSTTEAQGVRLDVDYPDVEKDLNRWLPLVKWILAIPHFIILAVLFIGVIIVTVIAWVSILLNGTYPRQMFDFVLGTLRWALRVWAYAGLLVTDEYPPFRLD